MGACENALAVLRSATAEAKVKAADKLRTDWEATADCGQVVSLPDNPERPEKPELVSRTEVPRRRLGSDAGRAALLHAVAHIELNAIDLAADMIARFSYHIDIEDGERASFIGDWVSVCHDESRHFRLLQARLKTLGYGYGDFPAHNGLWEAAYSTKDNFPARLAIAPMVLEARGLDVTPPMIEKLTGHGDMESVAALKIIYNDEIEHVATGARWFQKMAIRKNEKPESYFQKLVKEYYKGKIKPPFNVQARTLAGLKQGYYMPLT